MATPAGAPILAATLLGSLYYLGSRIDGLASRIEGLNKQFGAQFLISGEVWDAIGKSSPGAKSLGAAPVKGRAEPVQVHQLA